MLILHDSGAWLVFPTYMCWKFGNELVDGLAGGSSTSSKKSQ